jgi:hypothetical protein
MNFVRPCFYFICTPLLWITCSITLAQDSPYRPGPNRYPHYDRKTAEPKVTYGRVPSLPFPKTILYSVSPAALAADADQLLKLGFDAFFITGVASEWSTDVWGSDGESWTIGRSDKNWQTVRKANERCQQLGAETFLTMAFTHRFDWFDDLAWQKIENNFRQFALFAKTSGCTGVAIDIEYIGEQYSYSWEGYDYVGYSRRDLAELIRKRGTQIAGAVLDAFPEARFLTFPEQYYHLGTWLHIAWIEEAARRNAPGGIHYCTEYTYRRANIRHMFAHAWLNNRVLQSLLSEKGKTYWMNKCSIAEGLWPYGEDPDNSGHGVAPTPDEYRQAYAASLMAGSSYNWVYSHDAYEAMLGRSNKSYPGQAAVADYLPIMRERQMATNPEYVRLAQDMRRLILRDYSQELGLTLAAAIIGPLQDSAMDIIPNKLILGSPNAALQDSLWDIARREFEGEMVDLPALFPAQRDWLLIGPFANKEKCGFATIYPPELGINLNAKIDGLNGQVRWTEYHCASSSIMVNMAEELKPSEEVCAYALCYVKSDRARKVQIRVSGNDVWKLWIGGKLLHESADAGRMILDREVVPTTLQAGTTPILIKVCNNKRDWGFVLRITDHGGKPVQGLRTMLRPE